MAEEIFHHGGGGGGAAKVSISGANTDGTLTLISTGTMYMAGGNNITISQDGNSLTFIGMNNVGATTFRGGVSTGGNTLGTTGTVNNQIVFVGGNNVTLSQSANANSATVTISVPNTHAVQTGISGISASDAIYTSGTVLFTGSNMVTVKSSGAGQTVIIDATQSVQPEGTVQFGVSSGGNTSGTTGMASGTGPRLVFVGGNNITLSQSLDAASVSGTITISAGASGAGGLQSAGVSTHGNTAGTTGLVSSQVLFVGGSNVTLSQSSAAGAATITVNAVQSTGFVNSISVGGNTSGDTSAGTGKLALMGGNNITLSGSTAAGGITLTISGPNAGGAQTGISGIADSANTVTVGTVQFVNSNNVSFGLNVSTMTASFSQSVQPAQTGISGISGSNTVYVSGTVDFIGSNIVTVRSSAGQRLVIDASTSQSVQTWNVLSANGNTSGTLTSFTSGTIVLFGGNNITLSQASNSITISGAEGGGAGISTEGNTAGTTGIAGERLVLVGGSNITLSQSIDAGSSNATITIVGASGGGSGFTAGVSSAGNTDGTTGLVPSQIVFVGGSNVTLSQSINASSATITINGASGGTGAGYTAGISDIGNTSGSTGPVTGRLVLAGMNNITLSQSVDGGSATLSISGPTGGGAGMSTLGNTAGTTGTVGRELVFVGGSNISLSQSVNGASATLTINGATAGGGQTAISGIIASDTTYTSGTVSFVGSGIVTVETGTGQQVIINATGGGGGFTAGVSSLGNTAGTTGLVPAQIVFVGGSNISLSQSIDASSATITFNGLTIPAFTGGVSTHGNTVGDTGSVNNGIVFAGGNNVTLSQVTGVSGATITISGPNTAAQSVQTYNVLSADGNTSGTLTSFSTGTLVLLGGNNITLSQSSNSITISGANQGGVQTGISSIVAADATYTSGQVVFVGSNNITVTSGANQSVIISGPTGGGAGMGNSASGTAGTSGTVGRELYFYPGTNITLSQSVNGSSGSLTIIGATAGGGGIAASLSGNSSSGGGGYSLLSSGTMYLAGGNNITLSQDGVSVTISGANVGGAQTGISGIADSAATVTVGTVVFGDANNVSFGLNSVTMTASFSQSVQPEGVNTIGMSNLGNTAGTSGVVNGSNLQYYFAGGNNVTLSQSIDGSSATLTISGVNTVAQTAQTGISGLGANGTTFTSGTVVFSDANNVSFGTSGAGAQQTITVSASFPAQTNQNVVFYATSNTISSSVGTINASSIILRGNDQLSVGISNGSLIFEAGGADAGSQSIGISNLGNTSGTSGIASGSAIRYYFAGGNNVTLSQSINGASGTVTVSAISVPSSSAYAANVSNVSSAGSKTAQFALADHAHVGVAGINASGTASTFVGNVMISVSNLTLVTGGNSSAGTIGISAAAPGGAGPAMGVSNTGNTAGNLFTASNGTVYIQATNNITASASTAAGSLSTIWISGPTGGGAGMGTGTNTSGTSGTVGRQLYVYGNSNIGLSQSVDGSSASLTVIGLAGAGGATVSEWMPPGVGYSSFTQMGQSSLVMFQVAPPYYVTASRADVFASISVSTSSNSSHNGYVSLYMGVYTRNASTLSLASSGSAAKSWNVTGSTSSGSVVGWRDLTLPIDVNMTPGRYWVGIISVTNTSNANWFTASNMGLIAVPAAFSGPLGATNASNQFQLGNGVFSAQTAALPASVAFADIVATSASTARPVVNFVNLTI